LPSLVVIYNSFRKTSGPVFKSGFGLDSYRRIINDVPDAIFNSFVFSISAVLMIPYIVPGVVLGLGFIVSFNSKPVVLVGTATIIILVIFVRRLPYSVRSSVSILKQISLGVEEAAISLGASPAKTFLKVTLPLMMPGVFAGAMMAFITAINELSSSIILYVGGTVTMPVRIYLSVLDGEFGTAAALSSILLAATGVAVFAIIHITESDEGVFL